MTFFLNLMKGLISNKNTRIGFVINSEHVFGNFYPIYEAFKADKNFSPYVIPANFSTHIDYSVATEKLSAFLRERKIENIITMDDIIFKKIDSFFLFTPYLEGLDMTFSNFLISRKICYVPYGALVNYVCYNNHFYNNCWKIFLDNQYVKDKFIKLKGKKWVDKRCVVTGLPKLDNYKNLNITTKDYWPRERSINIKRIIVADHWTLTWPDPDIETGEIRKGYSQFIKYKALLLDLPKRYPQIDFVFRPHTLLFPNLIHHQLMNKDQIDEFLKEFLRFSNTAYDDAISEPDYIIPFKESDALICSGISGLFEYLPTGNPILFLTKEDGDDFNEYGQTLIKYHYRANEAKGILEFLEHVVIKGEDVMKEKRVVNMQQHMVLPEGGAGRVIKNLLLK